MATLNRIDLTGTLWFNNREEKSNIEGECEGMEKPKRNPITFYVDDAGNTVLAEFYIEVTRGRRKIEDGRNYLKKDHILVRTRSAPIISEISLWKEHDVVRIRGVIAEQEKYRKNPSCSFCKNTVSVVGAFTYVSPFHASLVKECSSREESALYMSGMGEVSNTAIVEGNLCTDPKMLHPKDLTVTQYQIAIDRKVKVATEADKTADYIWVKGYGNRVAVPDHRYLKKGSLVLIDGCLQRRWPVRKCTCPTCSHEFEWVDETMEIVPYATEYERNYRTEEEMAEWMESRRQQSLRDLHVRKELFFGHNPDNGDDSILAEDIDAGFDLTFFDSPAEALENLNKEES